ncbi:MAG: precorrin-2 dehydrogenase/sirohydrochlorin ferrochelatase family protein [Terriglobales bacterium]
MTTLFPMFVKLAGRKCLVVGAGPLAESKVEDLLHSGARVHVVAPDATPQIQAWASEARIAWEQRVFAPTDLDGASLVIAATSSDDVNQAVFDHAEARGIFCNAIDQPERCHFYFPAVVRRGQLQIAISSGGLSPSLAHRLRVDLEQQFGPEYEVWLEWLGAVRKLVLQRQKDPAKRKRLLARFASRRSLDSVLRSTRKRRGGVS